MDSVKLNPLVLFNDRLGSLFRVAQHKIGHTAAKVGCRAFDGDEKKGRVSFRTHTMRYHAHYRTAGQGGMLLNNVTWVFLYGRTITSCCYADMLNATLCERAWCLRPRISVGARYGVGCESPSPIHGRAPPTLCDDQPIGSNAQTSLLPRVNSHPCVAPHSEEDYWVNQRGLSR